MRTGVKAICILGFLLPLTNLVATAEARILKGVSYGRRSVPSPPGMGYCLEERWMSPTSLSSLGGCTRIIYMIDIKDERPPWQRVGISANIWLLSKGGFRKYKMASITIRQSGAGFYFSPKQYEDCVRWSNGEVRFLIELAPPKGAVKILNTRCRYVFRN